MSDTTQEPSISKENWFKSAWRPAMAWQYFAVCVFDFLLAPLMTAWYAYYTKIPYTAWKPITLSEGAAYHLAMGAIIGIAAWTRGQEKTALINNSTAYLEATGKPEFDDETARRIAEAKRRNK